MSEFNVFDDMGQAGPEGGSEFDHVVCEGFAKKYPNLNSVLFAKQNRGSPRDPGRLTVFVDEGKIKVCLACPTEGVCAFSVVESIENLCPVLEARLTKGKLEWRVDRKHKKGGKAPF